jgi:hypothetical protein
VRTLHERHSAALVCQVLFAFLLQGMHVSANQQKVRLNSSIILCSKKECPLCKISMGTKREMRDYRKLEDIIRILRPLIDKHQASEEDEYKSIYTKQMQEQHEMRLMHQKRQEFGGEF